MTKQQRTLLLRMAWFTPDTILLGAESRPLSLLSQQVIELIGLKCLDEKPVYESREEEILEVIAYKWIHDLANDPDEISRMLWTGEWREIIDNFDFGEDEFGYESLLEFFREEMTRMKEILRACEVSLKRKPPTGGADHKTKIPREVVMPDILALKMSAIMRQTNMSRKEIGWELPIGQAEQIWHSCLRNDGNWTVWAASAKSNADAKAFEGFGDFLNQEETPTVEEEDPDGDEVQE